MKEKHRNGCNILIMILTYLEKYVYSKKCSKKRRQPPKPLLSKVEGIFAPKESAGYRCYLQFWYAYPADRVTKRSVYRSP